jgi:hypothetical protein
MEPPVKKEEAWLLSEKKEARGEVHDDLANVLRATFPHGEVYRVNGDYLCRTMHPEPSGTIEVWCTKTALRNHADVLLRIRDDPVPRGVVREWTRSGYVIVVDLALEEPQTVVRVEIS